VFVRRGKLMAVPFDPQRLELTGAAVAVADDVMQAANIGNSSADSGAGQFAISPTGTLVYATGGIAPDDPRELDWVDRSGAIERFGDAPTMEYASPRISPDGSQVIMATQPSASGEGNRLWTYDIARHTLVAFTNRQELGMWPIWSPDGKRIAFNSLAAGGALTVKSADGTGASDSIKDVGGVAAAWSPSGQVAFITNGDIWVVDMTVPGHPKRVVVQTPAIESHPAFSPDGKWLAYTSAESGRIEVYVQPYPGPGARVLIAGGAGAAWRGDGRELYYYTAMDGVVTMMAVTVDTAAERVSVGQPRKLFEDRFVVSTPARAYDVTADGKRFVMVRRLDAPQPPPVHLVLVEHALEEIQRLAPRQR
jgi:Tol biopolymer transport system component